MSVCWNSLQLVTNEKPVTFVQSDDEPHFRLSDDVISLACYWWSFYWSFLFPFQTCEKERSHSSPSQTFENDRQTDRFVNFQLLYTGVSFLAKNLFIFHLNPATTPLSWKSGTPINICIFEKFDVIYESSIWIITIRKLFQRSIIKEIRPWI